MSKNITVNGATYDASYVSAPLADGSGNATFRESSELSLQSKSVTPTESQQTVTHDSGYFALDEVLVGAIPSEYVKPTSTNAGGELAVGSTISAGTYFTGEATVPNGGGWTPKVASGTATGTGTGGITITHNMGTKNIIIFVFNQRAISDWVASGSGNNGSWASMWSVIFNPKIFFNSGNSVQYDFSAYNTATGNNGVLNVDWSSYYGGIGIRVKAPYAASGTDFTVDSIVKKEDVLWFNENDCRIVTGETFGSGIVYHWFAYELPAFTSSQKMTIGTATAGDNI